MHKLLDFGKNISNISMKNRRKAYGKTKDGVDDSDGAGNLSGDRRRRNDGHSAAGTQTEVTTAEGQYRIQITDGKLALYRTGSSVPYQKLDMPLSLLSEYDLEQLESGITVGTEAELRQLVEDLTS